MVIPYHCFGTTCPIVKGDESKNLWILDSWRWDW